MGKRNAMVRRREEVKSLGRRSNFLEREYLPTMVIYYN